MTKRIGKSNVIPMSKRKAATWSEANNLSAAQEFVYRAMESKGKQRANFLRRALELSSDCVAAYCLLAEDEKSIEESVKLYRKAVAAGVRVLGKDWETKYEGVCWMAHETRPIMSAMCGLAQHLQLDDKLQEALDLYRKLMTLNPNDNQGIRYLLAGCLYEAGCDEELEGLLNSKQWKDDPSASLKYTAALLLFRKTGSSKAAIDLLKNAFKANPYVPIYLSDEFEMPAESPDYIGFGDESEAIAYVMQTSYLWGDTEGAETWMAETLADDMRKVIEDKEAVEIALKALKCEWDDDDSA
jgi:tetratricopeptide (TPR) repeat protein